MTASQPSTDKIMAMIRDREQKIIKEGEDARAVYAESTEWCEEPSNNDMSEIQTGD